MTGVVQFDWVQTDIHDIIASKFRLSCYQVCNILGWGQTEQCCNTLLISALSSKNKEVV